MKRLTLHKETLRSLDDAHLTFVHGGDEDATGVRATKQPDTVTKKAGCFSNNNGDCRG